MIKSVTGDILDSPAQCLVNTINCEGYMGKGLAYRFKMRYPLNYAYYKTSCEGGQVRIGSVLFFVEAGKIIANFPTKDRWKESSRYEYIEAGLADLKEQIASRAIASVAIPPLGCGNGGLSWPRVKALIEERLEGLDTHIYLHAPLNEKVSAAGDAANFPASAEVFQLGASHLVLLDLKAALSPFTQSRLWTAAKVVDLLTGKEMFPSEGQLEALCGQLRSFQKHCGVQGENARNLLHSRLISAQLELSLAKCATPVQDTARLVNSLEHEEELNLALAVACVAKERPDSTIEEIASLIAQSYTSDQVVAMVCRLEKESILERTLLGLRIRGRI